MIEDPALDEMWEAAEKNEGYKRVAETIESKKAREVIETVSKATITEYIRLGLDRMSVIKKGDTMIMLKAQGPDKDSGATSNEEDTAREGSFGTQQSHPDEQQ